MASLSLDLSQFKAAGVYTIEIDQSERVTVTTQSLRLVPGFSKTGPFNAPVFITSKANRARFYGDIDEKLERKGSFFHRSIDTCLLQSPVFTINLLNVNSTPGVGNTDTCNVTGLSVDTGASVQEDDFSNIPTDLYVNFFNRERFWKADPDYLQGVIVNKYSSGTDEGAPLVQLANVGTKTLSFIVRRAIGLSGYDVMAKDWYGSASNIPYSWIRPFDKMKEYFIQVIAIEGDWTNTANLSTDSTFSEYFNSNGLIPAKLNNFINLSQVNLIGSWVGSIIPDLRDQTGANQYIETMINSSVQLTGILININHQALDQLIYDEDDSHQWEIGDGSSTEEADYLVDLLGHNLMPYDVSTDIGTSNISSQFLSYNIDVSGNIFQEAIDIEFTEEGAVTGKEFYIQRSVDFNKITIGTLIRKNNYSGVVPNGVTYVTSKVWTTDVSTAHATSGTYILETAECVDNNGLSLPFATGNNGYVAITQKPIDDASIASSYTLFKMSGLRITSNHIPGYSTTGEPNLEEGLTKIYSMLDDEGIKRGLLNPDMINYRYIVDTMGNGLRPELGGKMYLSRLAKQRGKCTAILSAPSISHFASSQDPYFCDIFVPGVDPTPIFSTEWIPQGGNPDMARSFRFSLPTEDNGAKYMGVFGPFLRYIEGSKTILVPPAADVSNTFVRKFLGGDPFAIVANKNGIIANSAVGGVEYLLDQTDREYLEPFGYNSIVERASTSEVMIYSNRTSYQTIKSDYNYLHIRELLNTIELQIDDLLRNYVFEYNNAITRLNIINSVTPILQNIKDAGALYDYEIVMDESNNTSDVIDEAFAILDIGVWINKGMEKIISRISVNKLSSSGTGGSTTA